MRKIILDLAVTLDGFIEGPNAELDWLNVGGDDSDIGVHFDEFLSDIDTIFYGRKSYDLWGNYQPDGNTSPTWKRIYDVIHQKRKYVFSRNSTAGIGEATLINANFEDNVRSILNEPGKNIWLYGGGELITSFMNAGLVDVFRLAVHPTILASGKLLFKDLSQRVNLRLLRATPSSGCVMLLIYEKVTS